MKLLIDVEKDYYETLKYNVEHGQDYKPFEIIANGIPYEERPQGEWIMESKLYGGFGDSVLAITCSICKESFVYRGTTYNFCSNCGADMRGGAV